MKMKHSSMNSLTTNVGIQVDPNYSMVKFKSFLLSSRNMAQLMFQGYEHG